MRNIRTFEQYDETELLGADWRGILPRVIDVAKDVEGDTLERRFTRGNVIKNANMTQVIYEADEKMYGHPDEMSLDVYYYKNHRSKMTLDIMYGDMVACEFSVTQPSEVRVIEYTSYGSRFDPSDTLFALSPASVDALAMFINQVDGFKVTSEQLGFLARPKKIHGPDYAPRKA
jgi:hypothetical protein